MVLSLKIKLIFVALVALVILLANCSQKAEAEKSVATKDSVSCVKKPLNPNGDSELALLMRDMMKNSESLRALVMSGKLPEKFPEEYLKIHTAKPTDSETKKASFNAFADNYVIQLQKLYDSPKADLSENYNAVITACASCHGEHCPGPLQAINKLKLE